MFGTRSLLEAHIRDCREDRVRTAQQFNEAATAVRDLKEEFSRHSSENRDLQDRRHSENQAKLDKLQRVVYMAAGAIAVLGFLFSDYGHGLVVLLTQKP